MFEKERKRERESESERERYCGWVLNLPYILISAGLSESSENVSTLLEKVLYGI